VRHVPETCPENEYDESPAAPSLVPRLDRPEYYCVPSIEAMSKMSEAKLCRIDNLEVGRYGFGSVTWSGLTDVRRINFDKVVEIERGSITVYPNEDERPPIGYGLNKPAVIRFDIPHKPGKNIDALRDKLRKLVDGLGGTFLNYTGDQLFFSMPDFDGSAR